MFPWYIPRRFRATSQPQFLPCGSYRYRYSGCEAVEEAADCHVENFETVKRSLFNCLAKQKLEKLPCDFVDLHFFVVKLFALQICNTPGQIAHGAELFIPSPNISNVLGFIFVQQIRSESPHSFTFFVVPFIFLDGLRLRSNCPRIQTVRWYVFGTLQSQKFWRPGLWMEHLNDKLECRSENLLKFLAFKNPNLCRSLVLMITRTSFWFGLCCCSGPTHGCGAAVDASNWRLST